MKNSEIRRHIKAEPQPAMTKPELILYLETRYELTLSNLAEIPEQKAVYEWQALVHACAAGREADAPAFVQPVALDRMKMSVCKNTFLLDERGRLIALNLYDNGLPEFPFDRSAGLEHLRVLFLAGNLFTEVRLPPLSALQWLDLGDNKNLRALRFEAALPALEGLDCSDSGLERIEFPEGFGKLKTLDLSRNALREAVFGGDCPELEWLDLSGNKLKELVLPAGFGRLEYLYLNKNALKTLDFKRPLRNLNTLHLGKNKLSSLPEILVSFNNLESLYLHDNDWKGNFASVVPTGEYDNAFVPVRDYLRELTKGTRIKNDRVKIIIVGNGRTGKTSMFRRLKDLPFRADEKFTHGIDLGELAKKDLPGVKTGDLQANVWDFGGQHIFYATHQFFLTDDALYILAWTAEKNVVPYRERDKGKLPYDEKWRKREEWLENIRMYAPKSPIIMVQTHYDQAREQYNQLDYAAEPYYAECLEFAASNDHGLDQLQNLVTQRLNEAVPGFGEDFPSTYDAVIGEIERRKAGNKITRDAFEVICRQAGITPGSENSVLEFLNRVGAVVWFGKAQALASTVFVNPNWITEKVYLLINNELRDRAGRFNQAYLREKFKSLAADEQVQLIELLKNFGLIFEAEEDGKQVFIAPQYLPDELDGATGEMYRIILDDLSASIRFRFSRFTPENVMINFVSRYGPFSRKMYWKNGICFSTTERSKCIVRFDETGDSFQVFTQPGDAGQRLQAEVCRAFVELGRNARAEVALDGHCFAAWQELDAAVEDGTNQIQSSCGKKVQVNDFKYLFGKEMPAEKSVPADYSEKKKPMPPTQLRCFISYAHADDQRYMRCFIDGIKKFSDWEIFDDRGIPLGADWDKTLREEGPKVRFWHLSAQPKFSKIGLYPGKGVW